MAQNKPKIDRIDISKIELDDIYKFMSQEVNSGENLEGRPEIARYLELMDKVRSMYHRVNKYGNKESILSHLIKFEELSRYHANKLYENTWSISIQTAR